MGADHWPRTIGHGLWVCFLTDLCGTIGRTLSERGVTESLSRTNVRTGNRILPALGSLFERLDRLLQLACAGQGQGFGQRADLGGPLFPRRVRGGLVAGLAVGVADAVGVAEADGVPVGVVDGVAAEVADGVASGLGAVGGTTFVGS